MKKLKFILSISAIAMLFVSTNAYAEGILRIRFNGIVSNTPTSLEARVMVVNKDSENIYSEVWLECQSSSNTSLLQGNKISIIGSDNTKVLKIAGLSPNVKYLCAPIVEKSGGERNVGYAKPIGKTEDSSIVGNIVSTSVANSAVVLYTRTATDLTGSSAILNAEVDGKGGSVYWFEWGETDSLGKKTLEIGISYKENVNAYINNLKPEAIYYYRIAARNQYGVKYGSTFVFRTQSASVLDTNNSNTSGDANNTNTSSNGNTANTNGGTTQIRTVVEVRNNTTIIDGTIPAGKPVTAWFEWGKTNRLGNKTEDQSFDGKKEYIFSDTLYNLDENTEYYVQSVYEVDGQILRGEIVPFSTSPNAKRGALNTNTDASTSFIERLFGGATVDTSDGQTAGVGGNGGGIFGTDVTGQGSATNQEEIRKKVEKNMLAGFATNSKDDWGEYLQNRFFSISNKSAVFGIASTQFQSSEIVRQRASASGGVSFLPDTFAEWTFLIIFLVIIIYVARRMYLANEKRKRKIAEEKRLENVERESAVIA